MTESEKLPEASTPLSMAMRQLSRRGAFGWLGKAGLAVAGAGALAGSGLGATTASAAPAAGCPECWGACDPCTSACCCPCNTKCNCNCTGGCFTCNPTWIQAHLLWILGYIPNCTCPAC